MLRVGFVAVAAIALGLSSPGPAVGQSLQPVSYDTVNGGHWTYSYHDDGYSGIGNSTGDYDFLSGGLGQLTDGAIGGAGWEEDLGNGPAHEWVAWFNVQHADAPVVTFDFGRRVNLTGLSGVFANGIMGQSGKGYVYLPESIELAFSMNGGAFGSPISYTPDDAMRASGTSQQLEIDALRQTRYVQMTMNYYLNGPVNPSRSWVFLSEVQFSGSVPQRQVPEPSSIAMVVIGMSTVGTFLLRGRKRRA
jgi:hypothetical protein